MGFSPFFFIFQELIIRDQGHGYLKDRVAGNTDRYESFADAVVVAIQYGFNNCGGITRCADGYYELRGGRECYEAIGEYSWVFALKK